MNRTKLEKKILLPGMLRKLRLESKLTQEQLANELNIAVSTISGHENMIRRPFKVYIRMYADYFSKKLENVDNLVGTKL